MSALPKFILLMTMVFIFMMSSVEIRAQAKGDEVPAAKGVEPLTQSDIDGYVYMLPRLQGEVLTDPFLAGYILRNAKLNRRRAIFVSSKIAIVQAIIIGLLSPSELTEAKWPPEMFPSAEEQALVQKNMNSILWAQELTRKAAEPEQPH